MKKTMTAAQLKWALRKGFAWADQATRARIPLPGRGLLDSAGRVRVGRGRTVLRPGSGLTCSVEATYTRS
jgi:hypothetical protein